MLNSARKAIRIGLCILFVATVRDCGEAAIRLNSAFQALGMTATHHLMLRPRDQQLEETTVLERQQPLVQFLRYDAACNVQSKAGLNIAEDVTVRPDSRQVGVSVVLGPSVLQERGTAIVHDGGRVSRLEALAGTPSVAAPACSGTGGEPIAASVAGRQRSAVCAGRYRTPLS